MTNQPRSSSVARRPSSGRRPTSRSRRGIPPCASQSGRSAARRTRDRRAQPARPSRRARRPWSRSTTASATASGSHGQRGQLLERGRPHRPEAPEGGEEPLLAGRAEARDPVERALGHPLAPALAVEGDGEAVRLVADPLEEVEGLGAPRDPDRTRAGPGRKTSSNCLASDAISISSLSPSDSSTRIPTPSWPLPPSSSSSWGG